MGLLLFGLVIAAQDSWGAAAIGYGMEGFGATAAANIAVTYAVDAYRPVNSLRLFFFFFCYLLPARYELLTWPRP